MGEEEPPAHSKMQAGLEMKEESGLSAEGAHRARMVRQAGSRMCVEEKRTKKTYH